MASCNFGLWDPCAQLLNARYNNLYVRLKQFAAEIGVDPCDRSFSPSTLINFAIERKIASEPVDYIYKQFVYYKLQMADADLDVIQLELFDLIAEFILINVGVPPPSPPACD